MQGLDFADGLRAHVLAMKYDYNGNGRQSYALSTVDFNAPDAPTVASTPAIAGVPSVPTDAGSSTGN